MRDWMRMLRKQKAMTQEEVGKVLNMTASGYSCIERGTREKALSLDTAARLGKLFGVTLDKINEWENMEELIQL